MIKMLYIYGEIKTVASQTYATVIRWLSLILSEL